VPLVDRLPPLTTAVPSVSVSPVTEPVADILPLVTDPLVDTLPPLTTA
jgi:hypothetical protein